MKPLMLKDNRKGTTSMVRMLALISCLTIALATQAIADTTYTYTATLITGSFTIDVALPPNMPETQIYPQTYSFSVDGYVFNQITSPLNPGVTASYNSIWVSTNALGNITTDWDIRLLLPLSGPSFLDVQMQSSTSMGDLLTGADVAWYDTPWMEQYIGTDESVRTASNWTKSSSEGPTATAEPSTLLLLAAGLSGLWVWGRTKFSRI